MPKREKPNANAAGSVRIIAGQYRGRRLPVPSVDGLRPTGDRVRETVFNWLQARVPGARCLDAFAGSGALGFEAASRYAESVVMVEADYQAAQNLKASRQLLNANHVSVVHQRFEAFAEAFAESFAEASTDAHTEANGASASQTFDGVFLDPPFQHTDFSDVFQRVQPLLAKDAWVYIECPKTLTDEQSVLPEHWVTQRDKILGDVRVRLCQNQSHE
jgi:16S rRNA (guanine966-N2)-methyltransferase